MGARARSAHAFGAERVARGSDPAASGTRARSAPTPIAIGAERVARGDAGSQCALGLAGLPPAVCRPRGHASEATPSPTAPTRTRPCTRWVQGGSCHTVTESVKRSV